MDQGQGKPVMYDDVQYQTDEKPSPEELLRFYNRQGHTTEATLDQVRRMMDKSSCFVTARRAGQIIGFSRGVTDGLLGRLVECKLDPKYQGPAAVTRTDGRIEHDQAGIAKQMAGLVLQSLWDYGVERIDVLAYGTEVDFCEEMGFKKLAGLVALGLTKPASGQMPAAEVPQVMQAK